MDIGVGELRYDAFELSQDGGSLAERHSDIEFVQAALQRRPGEPYALCTGDLGAGAGQNPLVRIEELLEEFFASTQPHQLKFLAGFADAPTHRFYHAPLPN